MVVSLNKIISIETYQKDNLSNENQYERKLNAEIMFFVLVK